MDDGAQAGKGEHYVTKEGVLREAKGSGIVSSHVPESESETAMETLYSTSIRPEEVDILESLSLDLPARSGDPKVGWRISGILSTVNCLDDFS